MSRYQDKLNARRARYEARAEKNRERSHREQAQSESLMEGIPMGQPILIGHHSERRHRKTLERSHKAMSRALQHDRKARYYSQKAASVGLGGISSDDPEAVDKLREKLTAREQRQTTMKAVNRVFRRSIGDEQKINQVVKLGIAEAEARRLLKGDVCGCVGFPHYALQNNNSEIRRIKKRIEAIEAAAGAETSEERYGAVVVRENTEINRIQLIFPGKPGPAVRERIGKRGLGFRWARTEGAWQRHLNNAGRAAARAAIRFIEERGGWE